MPELFDAFRLAPDQDIDQVHRPKTLSGAIGAGQQFLCDDFAIAKLRRRQAVVAIAAFGGAERFAEISEQPGAPAVRGFGETDKRLQLADRHPLERFRARGLLDHAPLLYDIRQPISHPGAGWLAVAPRAPGLLIIGIEALRQIEMRNEAHV